MASAIRCLLTLLELAVFRLHHENHRSARRGAEGTVPDMGTSHRGSAAWTGSLPGSGSTVSVLVATAIVVADMVGVGVFTSLGFQVKDIPSGFSILLLRIVGGLGALLGV